MVAALALLSSLLWGAVDFLGGTVSRRLPAVAVVGSSQAVGLVTAVAVALAAGALSAPAGYLPWAVLAGLAGVSGLVAFYAALAVGTMGVVSPIAALGVVVPVAVALLRGESPSLPQLLGAAVAIGGVVLASGPELSGRAGVRPLLLAAGSAVGFGVALLAIAEGSRTSTLMTLVGMRATSVTVLALAAVLARTLGGLRASDLPVVAVVGVGDLTANLAFGLAATSGLVSVVAVLGSLYPVVTVLLARLVHGERLEVVQRVGVSVALGGVVLIAAAGGAG
ncbi:MAG: EamA family transporter [Actinomycetota bacterium]